MTNSNSNERRATPADADAGSNEVPRIEALLRMPTYGLKLPRDLRKLFVRRTHHDARLVTAAWCFWVSFLVLSSGGFDFALVPSPVLPGVLAFRMVLTASLGLVGWLLLRGVLIDFAGLLLGVPCVMSVLFSGFLGATGHNDALLTTYMNEALMLNASAIIFAGFDLSFCFGIFCICLPLIIAFVLKSDVRPYAARLAIASFDACAMGTLIYGRYLQNLVLARLFLLNYSQELRNAEAAVREKALSDMAYIDPLTEIPNRRYFDEICDSMAGSTKSLVPVCMCMIDIDHFKKLNDSLGHLQGDRCLKLIGAAIRNSLRNPADIVARYGGEEFVLVLPRTSLAAAKECAERVRLAVENLEHPNPGSPFGIVTASIGVAELTTPPLRPRELLRNADQALYAAKTSGRNRVNA